MVDFHVSLWQDWYASFGWNSFAQSDFANLLSFLGDPVVRKRRIVSFYRTVSDPIPEASLALHQSDGVLKGIVWIWGVQCSESGRIFPLLGPLVLDPSVRGTHESFRLMETACAHCCRLGFGGIFLSGAPCYYERHGFSEKEAAGFSLLGSVEPLKLLGRSFYPGFLSQLGGVMRPLCGFFSGKYPDIYAIHDMI